MLPASFLAARVAIRRSRLVGAMQRLGIRLVAFALLMAMELAGAVLLRRMPPADRHAHFATPEGFLPLGHFVEFAAIPVLAWRGTSPSSRVREEGMRAD